MAFREPRTVASHVTEDTDRRGTGQGTNTEMTTDVAVPQSDHFRIELDPADVTAAYSRHRRRFASAVAPLDEAALRTPSRCSEWTVGDVLRHGCDVDRWIRSIWVGELPFAGFDPRVTPHESVIEARSVPDVEIRDLFVASTDEMATEVEGAGPDRWGLPSLSPAGVVPWWQSLLHVLFDSWLHERDVLLPLGLAPDERDDELAVVLSYSLAIVPHAGRLLGRGQPVDASVCGIRVTAADGRPVLVAPADPTGPAPEAVPVLDGHPPLVIDALSGRGALDEVLTGDREVIDRLGVLARFFTSRPG
jgi:uncharacterized protein (TIGR03083 family)